jgi:hypothetical protein
MDCGIYIPDFWKGKITSCMSPQISTISLIDSMINNSETEKDKLEAIGIRERYLEMAKVKGWVL